MRKFWGVASEFDEIVQSNFELMKEEVEIKESMIIWQHF
jgi:hypothetical protein